MWMLLQCSHSEEYWMGWSIVFPFAPEILFLSIQWIQPKIIKEITEKILFLTGNKEIVGCQKISPDASFSKEFKHADRTNQSLFSFHATVHINWKYVCYIVLSSE